MIDGTFDIAIDTPKRHRRGTLALKSDGNAIAALLNVGEIEGLRLDGTCEGKDFKFSGTSEFGDLGAVEYEASGNVWGNSVTITCETSIGKTTLFGTRISSAAGEFESSHKYIMSASRCEFENGDSTMYSGLYADGG